MAISPKSPAQRAADWLELQLNADGSLRGGDSINEYYKGVCALACAGRNDAAERMLNYIARRFLQADGDLDGRGCAWFDEYRIYCHAWVAMAALQLGRVDVSERVLRFLEKFHDPRAGGFYGNLAERERQGKQEMMTTGVVAIALLWGGRVEIGRQVAGWMKNLWAAQPDIRQGLSFVWHSRDGLVADFPADKAVSHRVDVKKPAQWYFQYGVASAFLSAYSGAAGDPAALKLARDYLQASRFLGDDAYLTPQIGKVGWGAAWTLRLSGDAQDRALRDRVHAALVAAQSPEGWWPGQTVYGQSNAPATAASLDITGEFAALLSWMERPAP